MVLASVESQCMPGTLCKLLVKLQQSGENIALVLRRKTNGVNFLLLLKRDDEFIGVLK